MNKIVREHYPAAKLPEELRQGLDADARVRIVIEEEASDMPSLPQIVPLPDLDALASNRSQTVEELLETIRMHKARYGSTTSGDEAVQRIRALRDEWDDE
ncbi:hypothetical protein [Rhizobium sp. CC-YZS058]|uniref:hypothetical protein n=1 Tax=Rhizobium sp. CC-YZS058 TaxID=3042153 RepID=UPI002B05330E|nr:hypothetical protein [Rhizobium sp. CC-YZS058]MEA3533377.1 hypothetical protein [Rhizobium sp. CC-YZS058]